MLRRIENEHRYLVGTHFFEKLKIMGKNLRKINSFYGKVSHTLKFNNVQFSRFPGCVIKI